MNDDELLAGVPDEVTGMTDADLLVPDGTDATNVGMTDVELLLPDATGAGMADADLLAPDATGAGVADAELLATEAGAAQGANTAGGGDEAAAAAAARERQAAFEAEELAAVEAEVEAEEAAVRKSGKRRVIQHGWTSDPAGAIDQMAPEEVAKREARAAKYGLAPPAPLAAPAVLIGRDEVLAREARAAKFGVETPFNPLDAIASAQGGVGKGKALWEKRRDAEAEELVRHLGLYKIFFYF